MGSILYFYISAKVLVSLGFIPHEYKDIANRCKLESALP